MCDAKECLAVHCRFPSRDWRDWSRPDGADFEETDCVQGVEYVPELKKFYTSNAHDDTIGVVDLKQMKVVKKLKTAPKPDGSTYAAPFHKLYVSDERGKAEAIVDVQKDEIASTLRFNSENSARLAMRLVRRPSIRH